MSFKNLIGILVVLLVTIFVFFPSATLGWWNENFQYRKKILINNTLNPTELRDYNILVNFSLPKNKIHSNFTNLRFTWYNLTDNTEIEIPYWIENDTINETIDNTVIYNGSLITIAEDANNWYVPIWIKIKQIPAKGYATIYAYYGNPHLTSFDVLSNNGTATFLHFEDWEECTSSNNCTNWIFSGSGSTTFQVVNSNNTSWKSRSGVWFSRVGIVWDDEIAIAKKKISIGNISESFRFIGGLKLGYISTANTNSPRSWCPSPYKDEYISYKIGLFNGSQVVYLNYYISQGILLTDSHPEYYFLIRNYENNCFDTYDAILAWNNTPFTIINRDISSDLILKGILFTELEILNFTIYAYGYSPEYFKWVGEDLHFITPLSHPEPTYFLNPEESQLSINLSHPKEILLNDIFPIFLNATHNNSFLTNLTLSNFKVFLGNQQIEIINLTKLNGNYLIFARANTSTLGQTNLKVSVSYDNLVGTASSPIFISTPIKQKILLITDHNWRNVYSLSPLKKPILITNETNEKIQHFINLYRPEQIFILGDVSSDINYPKLYRIFSYEDISKLFLPRKKGVYAGKTDDVKNKVMLASQLAALLDKPLVFNSGDAEQAFNFENLTEKGIKEIYLQNIKENGKNINYLIISKEADLVAPIIASQKVGFISDLKPPNTTNPQAIMKNINETVGILNSYGLFINNTQYLLDAAYILLLGNIAPITKEDPVKFLGLFDDPEDGDNFTTDLEYGDLNNDTYLDVAVGRLPEDEKTASLMFARTFLPDNKKALVASEYLHTAWPVILLYAGGGMWQGRSIAKILEDQNYDITRLVEHRSDPVDFFYEVTDVEGMINFLNEANNTAEDIKDLLGDTIGSIACKVFLVLKVLNYAEQVLEMYLEYDWSSFGPKWQEAINFLKTADWSEDVRKNAIRFVVNLLWPYPWADIGNKTSLQEELQGKDIIYYVGIGNKTNWILPNYIAGDNGFLDLWQFFENSYNGSNYLLPEEIPNLSSRLVWDNANFGGISKMKDAFLEKGTASLIGASALNYNQFSAEIDSRFFKHENVIGNALIMAINDFRDDWLTYDPLNILKPGIKAKTLREFILWGDPSLQKDPIIEPERYFSSITCDNGVCEQNVTIPLAWKLINTTNETTILVDTEDHLLELFRPIIPLIEFEYYLPFSAEIVSTNVTFYEINFTNITLPRIELLQHGINYTNETISTEWYPENISRLDISSTIDNRTRIKLIHAAIKYNESSKDATLYEKILLNLKYKAPIEFSISTKNITLGETQDVEIKIWSNISDNATIYLQFANSTTTETFAFNITIELGFNNFTYSYIPTIAGTYEVKAILVKHNPLIVGPRKSVFIVKEITIQPPPTQALPTTFLTLAPIGKKNETNVTIVEKEVFPPVEEVKNEKVEPICGNGICEQGETQESCPADCIPEIKEVEITKPTGLTGFFVFVAEKLPILLLFLAAIIAIILILKIKVF